MYRTNREKLEALVELELEIANHEKALIACKEQAALILEERDNIIQGHIARADGLEADVQDLRALVEERDSTIMDLRAELDAERRLNRNAIDRVTAQDQMLALVCAYRTDDEWRDGATLLQDNLDLEEKVKLLKAQVKRLAHEAVQHDDDD
jgi:outer membrane murein-binding lipoprotein Lpp